MIEGLPTLDDVDCSGKTVLVRLDVNSPIINSTILDTLRIESHAQTLRELEDSTVVLIAHQSRPGKKDFTTLEIHAAELSKVLGRDVEYIDECFSSRVLKKIKSMKRGDMLMLENVRFYSEERLKRSPEEHSTSFLVQRLYPNFDCFVNDAFSACHRPHASLIGFPPVLPSVVGRLVEREVLALSKVLRGKGKKIFVLGGAKIEDSVKVMKNVLERGIAEKVILTGVAGNYFLMLSGIDIGEINRSVVEDSKEGLNDEEMKKLYEKYRDRIILPVDVAVEEDGKRKDVELEGVDNRKILDIGLNTISLIKELVPQYDIAVINGPAGVFEDERFALGTFETLKAVSKAGYSVVGGGHIATAARMLGIARKMSHVSIAGGACIRFLSGEKLVALEVIKKYWEKKWSIKFM